MSVEFMKKEIASFEETKDLKYESHEITTIYEYVKLKRRFQPSDSYEPVLRENPFRVEFVPSKRHEQELKQREKDKNVDTTYHNDFLLDAKLSDFELLNNERKEAIKKVKAFIDNFSQTKPTKGLYIVGQNRTGKTFLLSAIVNELAKKDIKTIFAYVPDLIRRVHSSIDDGLLEEQVKNLKNCQLLVLDDLGGAFMNRWFRDQIFGPVIQYRLSVGLPILVSSNLELSKLSNFMIDEKLENDKFSAVRITSRIHEMTEPVTLNLIRYT